MVAAGEGIEKLLSAIPLFNTIRAKLVEIEEKFSEINYYKSFALNVDTPSVIPIEVLEGFALFMESSKKEILRLDGMFDKNKLPKDLREIYIAIFLIVVKEDLPKKGNGVALGYPKPSNLWLRKVSKVVRIWETQEPYIKVGYSTQAYRHIQSYLPLINLINELEAKLLF